MTGTDATWVTQFLGGELTAEENRLETAACEIIPCGLEKTVSYGSGTAAGPAAIISASHQLELAHSTRNKLHVTQALNMHKKAEKQYSTQAYKNAYKTN